MDGEVVAGGIGAGGSGPRPGPTYDRADGKVLARGTGIGGSGCGNDCERYDRRVAAGGIDIGGSGGRLVGACAKSGMAGSAEMRVPSTTACRPLCGLACRDLNFRNDMVTCRSDEQSGWLRTHLRANRNKAGTSARSADTR